MLVLASACGHRYHCLAQCVLVSAVDGVRTAAAAGPAGGVQLLAGEGGQGDFFHRVPFQKVRTAWPYYPPSRWVVKGIGVACAAWMCWTGCAWTCRWATR